MCKKEGALLKIISIKENIYPKQLKNILNPPEILYAEGNLKLLNNKSIAIIGSRHPSENGIKLAKKFSTEISKLGLTVISGLARGIDTISHNCSCDNIGKTIAVLGSGFNKIFPPENASLYKKILENDGLVISEYPPNEECNSSYFPARNRIISGLSIGVLVIEAKFRSGTTRTVKYAIEQHKPVFALPHEIDDPHGVGTNRMLKKGAILVTETLDILDKLHLDDAKKQYLDLKDSEEKNIENTVFSDEIQSKLYKLICNTPISANELAKKTKFSINDILSALFILEMNGFIKKVEGGFVCTRI